MVFKSLFENMTLDEIIEKYKHHKKKYRLNLGEIIE
jgi:hypothetical protein